jgi:hypothetical protein
VPPARTSGLFWADHGQPGSYSGPEVGFEEIAIDLRQARFWITSGWPTTHQPSAGHHLY